MKETQDLSHNPKPGLRRLAAQLNSSLTGDYIAESDKGIASAFLSLPEYEECTQLLIYASFGREPDTYEIIRAALKSGRAAGVPLWGEGTMRFVLITSLSQLSRRDKFGIPCPEDGLPSAVPDSKTLVAVPGLMFTPGCKRLGRGAGYYDKYLENFPGKAVGLCRGRLIIPDMDTLPHDVVMRAVVTEDGVYRPAGQPACADN